MSERPPQHLGMHHVALFVRDLEAARHFYVDLLGFAVEWEPDADNLYVTSGSDNLALHRRAGESQGAQRLDHIGIVVADAAQVSAWHDHLLAAGVTITAAPRKHRDGAHSFYCLDPDGTRVQVIFHPPIVAALSRAKK